MIIAVPPSGQFQYSIYEYKEIKFMEFKALLYEKIIPDDWQRSNALVTTGM
jgi:hypothetical protein